MRRRVLIVVSDGVSDGSLGLTFDVLRAATQASRAGLVPGVTDLRFEVRVVAARAGHVTTAAGRRCEVDAAFPARPRLEVGDCVVVPGLGMATPAAIDAAFAGAALSPVLRFLTTCARTGATLFASCSATFLLAEAGLLDGLPATTTWWLAPSFRARYPAVELTCERTVVATGRCVTAGSSFAHADLMLHLLRHAAGPGVAHVAARYLLLDERPSQSHYMILDHLRVDQPMVNAVDSFVRRHLGDQLRLADLARVARTSPRTLARRLEACLGITPMQLVQQIRIAQAVHLLETTTAPFDAIAAQVGYVDPSALRKLLRRRLDRSPRQLRRAAPPPPPDRAASRRRGDVATSRRASGQGAGLGPMDRGEPSAKRVPPVAASAVREPRRRVLRLPAT